MGMLQGPLGDLLNTKRPIAWLHLLRKTMTTPFLNHTPPSNHTPHTSDHPAAFVCYTINTPAPCLQGGEFETSFPISLGCLAKKHSLCCKPQPFQYFGLLCRGQNEPGSVTETMARNDRDLNARGGGQDAKRGLGLKKF